MKQCLLIALLSLCLINVGFALHDPTMPFNYKAKGKKAITGRLLVSSVLISKHRRLAMVDGKYYTVGDLISGAKILAIEPDRVIFMRRDKKIIVPLAKTIVKRYPGGQK